MTQHLIVSGSIPKYRQLLQILRNQILSGLLKPGQQLPTEEELSLTYGLSRGTVRKAVAQLEAERLVFTEHGIGSFVRDVHPNAIPFRFSDERHFLGDQESVTTYKVLTQKVVPAPIDVSDRLRISPDTRVIHVARLQLVDGRPVAFSDRYLPESLCPPLVEANLSAGTIHDFLVSRSELPLLRTEIEIEAHILNAEEASLLQVEPGEKAIVMERLTYTALNRPAVWLKAFFKEMLFMQVLINNEYNEPVSEAFKSSEA